MTIRQELTQAFNNGFRDSGFETFEVYVAECGQDVAEGVALGIVETSWCCHGHGVPHKLCVSIAKTILGAWMKYDE